MKSLFAAICSLKYRKPRQRKPKHVESFDSTVDVSLQTSLRNIKT